MTGMNEVVICAGSGGQGIMLMGKILAVAGMEKGLNVTWMPSYGAEVRGGTAYTIVKIENEEIASPMADMADTAIIMNGPSLRKFESRIKSGGLLILNTSLAIEDKIREDIEIARAALTDEAIGLGNVKVANVIAIGMYLALKDLLDEGLLKDVIKKFGSGKPGLIEINIKALERGVQLGEQGSAEKKNEREGKT